MRKFSPGDYVLHNRRPHRVRGYWGRRLKASYRPYRTRGYYHLSNGKYVRADDVEGFAGPVVKGGEVVIPGDPKRGVLVTGNGRFFVLSWRGRRPVRLCPPLVEFLSWLRR